MHTAQHSMNKDMYSAVQGLVAKVGFTLFVLFFFRLGSYVPLSTVDVDFLSSQDLSGKSGMMSILDTFTGGALSRASVFSLGVIPYVVASILVQVFVSYLKGVDKKSEPPGRFKMLLYTRIIGTLLCVVQAFSMVKGFSFMLPQGAIISNDLQDIMVDVLSLVGGFIVVTLLGERITENGIGNGISMIILSGILLELPSAFSYVMQFSQSNGYVYLFIALGLFFSLLLFSIFIENSYYPVQVNYHGGNTGNKFVKPQSSYIPIKINMAGVMPPIFANAILSLPFSLSGLDNGFSEIIQEYFVPGSMIYMLTYSLCILFFSFFYVSMIFDSNDISNMLKKNGGVVNAKRPGANTAKYIDGLIRNMNVFGSIYLCVMCMIPEIVRIKYGIPFSLGGTSILIMVTVTVDILSRMQAHMFSYQYKRLSKKGVLFV